MRWLLRLLVSDADRRAIENDLAELHELRRRQDGDRAAARWLRRQRLIYPLLLVKDRFRAALSDRTSTMPHLWRDFAYSVRSLARTPALATTIILTVGVGLGATTGMVSVVQAVLVNPLPYADSDSLFWIYTDNPPFRFRFSVVDYRALEADHPAFTSVAAYQTSRVTVTDSGTAERVSIKTVTGSYFPLLGQAPVLGRLFDASDDAVTEPVAVLTHAYWTRRFAADPAVLGRMLTINGTSHLIVGVLQRDVGPLERDVAAFTVAHWPAPRRKGPFFTMALARLRPDASQAAATSALRATNARLFPIWRSSYQDEKATWGLQDLKSRVVGDTGTTLLLVLAAVGCVLLIACANAINLLVARALARGRELSIRSALGASRGRLVQHLVTESAVLTVAAALVGAGVTAVAIGLVRAYGADYIPRVGEVRMSAPVVGWLATLSVAAGLLTFAGGLVPALRGSRLRLDRDLRSSTRSTTDGPAARRLRRALVSAEFVLATPLIIAAVLVLASLNRLTRVDVGLDADRLLTAEIPLVGPRYAEEAARDAFWRRAVDRFAVIPGVEAAAIADSRPPDQAGQQNNFDLEDRPTPPGQNQPICPWVGVSTGFFKTAGLPILRGRGLDDRSLQNDEIVVDRAWAERFFPGGDAIGRRLRSGGCTTCPWTTVVGLVGTVKWVGLDAADTGTVYFPLVDLPNGFVTLRATGNPLRLAAGLRLAVEELDPALAPSDIATGTELVSDSLAAPRYATVLVGLFALTALVLSVVGVYGVMAYFVQQRTRDIGIRIALGGAPSEMRRLVVAQGAGLAVLGVALGVVVALGVSRWMTSQLFEVSATDLRVVIGVPAALVAVAAVACLIPAHRAARVDPSEILRES